jgi:hypothetical protein
MTWHSATIAPGALTRLLVRIRQDGGTITSCTPHADVVDITWTTRT